MLSMKAAWILGVLLILGGIGIIVWRIVAESPAPTGAVTVVREGECAITEKTVKVNGNSISELYESGAEVLAEFGYYKCQKPKRGELALVEIPGREKPAIKIISVMPGDKFELKEVEGGKHLVVNGSVLETPKGVKYLFKGSRAGMLELYVKSLKGVMKNDTFFIFGTQPGGSRDSSRFGPVTIKTLVGRVRP
jgi:signal peptidase I